MTIETDGCVDEAVLWPVASYASNGRPRVAAPIEIMSRWERGARQIMGPDDQPIGTTGIVMVDREIGVGSIIRLGALADLPNPPNGLAQVVDYEEVPDVKGEEVQRNVVIRRWKDFLPEVV